MVYLELPVREKRTGRPLGKETQGTEIRAAAIRVIEAHKLYGVGAVDLVVQGLEFVVTQGGQHRVFLSGLGVLHGFGGNGGQGAPYLHVYLLPA